MSDDIILRDLTDEQLLNLSDDDAFKIQLSYKLNGVPYRNTVKGLLEELDIKYDDLTDFILNFNVGRCNSASRNKDRINIYRQGNNIQDKIIINLNDSSDVPDVVVQIQVSDVFIHEEAYNKDGLLIYQS